MSVARGETTVSTWSAMLQSMEARINQYNDTAATSNNTTVENTQNLESVSEPDSTGENITSEVSSPSEDSNNSFSDDDIPF